MRNLRNELKDKIINFDKLLEYGFKKEDNQYIFKTKIYNQQFEMSVYVLDNTIYSKLIDLENENDLIYELIDNSYNLSLLK